MTTATATRKATTTLTNAKGGWIELVRPARVLLWANLALATALFGGLALVIGPLFVTEPERAVIRLSVYWDVLALALAASLTYFVGSWLERH